MAEFIVGRNTVNEAIRGGREINKILVAQGVSGKAVQEIISMARDKGIPYQEVSKKKLDTLSDGEKHQGVLAFVAAYKYADIETILANAESKGEPPFIVILDELEDPHNFGSILRSCEGAGAHGVIIPKRRSVAMTGTVAKTSVGAIEYVPVARVSNLVQTIDTLKEKGLWVVGLDVSTDKMYWQGDLKGPIAVVVGSEGKGIGRLIRNNCDFIVKIPMLGKINSLNASVATGIVLYEIVRQRME